MVHCLVGGLGLKVSDDIACVTGNVEILRRDSSVRAVVSVLPDICLPHAYNACIAIQQKYAIVSL